MKKILLGFWWLLDFVVAAAAPLALHASASCVGRDHLQPAKQHANVLAGCN